MTMQKRVDRALKASLDWPRFTPALFFDGNASTLTVTCPGALTYSKAELDASGWSVTLTLGSD